MYRLIRALLGILLCLPLPAFAEEKPAAPTVSAALDTLIPAIDAHFAGYIEKSHVPGLVYGIVRDGRLIHVGAMGVQDLDAKRPVNAESLFRIASMSKAFTALAILKLRDEGRLTLDTLAETYVPELRGWRYPTSDSPRIRVRDLLNHVGGFVTDDPWGDRQQDLSEAEFTMMPQDGVPFTRPPDTAFEYSNFGYALLGRIVTNVSGRRYTDFIRARDHAAARHGLDRLRHLCSRRSSAARSAIAGRMTPTPASRTWRTARSAQWAASRRAPVTTPAGSASCSRPGRRATGPRQGPVRRSSVRELSQGLNFPQVGHRPGGDKDTCRSRDLRHGHPRRRGLRAGFTVAPSGGYPGYGSFMLLLADHGIGIFAFANRTYWRPPCRCGPRRWNCRRAAG